MSGRSLGGKYLAIARFIFAAAFLAFLAVPGILTLGKVVTGAEVSSSQTENRRLDTFSAIPDQLARPNLGMEQLPGLVDTAFEDQLVIRMGLTRTLNSGLVHGFTRSTAAEMSIGPGRYWFRTGSPVFDLLSCVAPEGLNEAAYNELAENLTGFSQRMDTRGVRSAVLIVPNKAAIYPEQLPAELAERCVGRETPSARLARNLQARGVLISFDLDWFQSQDQPLLWDQRNYHWSTAGGRLYLRHELADGVLSGLGVRAGPIELLQDRELTEQVDVDGRLGVFPQEFSTPFPAMPEGLDRIVNGVIARDRENLGNYARFMRGGELRSLRLTFGERETGRAMLIGDSFSRRADDYFARNFAETLIVQTNDMVRPLPPGIFDELIAQYDPEIVIFMFEQAKFEPVNGSERARDWISAFEPATETNP